MVAVSINADLLRWAMDEARITPEDLEDRARTERGSVGHWLDGESPSLGELRRVAKTLDRSVQFFLLPTPPTGAVSSTQFRASLHDHTPEPEKEAAGVRSARRAQKFAQWAQELQNPRILAAHQQESPSSYADRLKAYIGWTHADQQGATSKSAVFRNLRNKIEALDVIVLLQAAGERGYRGFSLEGTPPIIFVNKDYSGAALRTFTLLHEVAHLGAGTGGVSCYYDDSTAETWCNRVATEFLLPRVRFVEYMQSRGVDRVTERNLDPVRLASNYFKASWLAVAIRLTEVGLADASLPGHVRENYDLERDPSTPIAGIDRSTPVIRGEEFGWAYIGMLRRAVQSDQLSELEASRLVRANAAQLRTIWSLSSGAG